MNYHVIIDDKFIESFIDDVYEIGEENNNEFLLRLFSPTIQHIKSLDRVQLMQNNDDLIIKLNNISTEDVVFVHWYDQTIAEIIEKISNRLVVLLWGGEMYEMPFWRNFHWLYDINTKKFLKNKMTPPIIWSNTLEDLWKSIIQRTRYFYKYPDDLSTYEKRLEQIRRIDVLGCMETGVAEVSLIRKLYPGSNFIHMPFFYDQNFSIAEKLKSKNQSGRVRILLGNSATATNNHLDALEILKNMDVDVYCPLSYGDQDYKDFIMNYGRKKLNNRFYPVSNFMNRKQYVEFLNSMDVICMYHNRSQAWGNIVSALTLGKPVFLKKVNPLVDNIQRMEMNCYFTSDLENLDLNEIIKIESLSRNENIEKLRKHLSDEKRRNDLRTILDLRNV